MYASVYMHEYVMCVGECVKCVCILCQCTHVYVHVCCAIMVTFMYCGTKTCVYIVYASVSV